MTREDSPKVLNEVQIRGHEAAGRLFDSMVDDALAGKEMDVLVTWHDDVDEHGEAFESPRVTIGGRTARNYARRLLEYTTTDEAYIEATSKAFAESMGLMWEDTLTYYSELDQLGLHLDLLVTSSDVDFWDQAKAKLAEEVPVGPLNPESIHKSARELACLAVAEWAEAVEAAEIQE